MLCLVFYLGAERYAIEARQVLEVIPMVRIKAIPQSPPGVAGLMHYRGNTIPVLDLSELATGHTVVEKISTRIVIVNYSTPISSGLQLGLLAERVTETVRIDDKNFNPAGVQLPNARYLGPVARDARGMIQKVEISELIPAEVQNLLYPVVLNGK